MQLQPSARFVKSLEGSTKAAGFFAIFFGVLALLGWLLKFDLLRSVLPHFSAIGPLSAVGFICAGESLWLLQREDASLPKQHRAGLALAVVVLLFGVAKLISFVTGWN